MDNVVQSTAVSRIWEGVEGRQREVGAQGWGWDGTGDPFLCSVCTAEMKMLPPVTNSNQRLNGWSEDQGKSTLVLIPSSRIRCGVGGNEGFLTSLPEPHSCKSVARRASSPQLHRLVHNGHVRVKIHYRLFLYRKHVQTARLLQSQVIES